MLKAVAAAIVITLFALPTCASSQPAVRKSASLYEVFLLSVHLHYAYDLYKSSWYGDDLFTSAQVDSGIVEYVVEDSSVVDDTTIVWHVREYRSLWHINTSAYPANDTTYYLVDTAMVLVYEHLTDRHGIESSGLIWSFPLYPGPAGVERFSDTTDVTVVRHVADANGSANDSVLFSASMGLHFGEFSSTSYSPVYYYGDYMRYELRGVPTAARREDNATPREFTLMQNYPNPFNPSTRIAFSIPGESFVSLVVYDILGREVATLVREVKQAGESAVPWNAAGMPSGMYFCRLKVGRQVEMKKMILIR